MRYLGSKKVIANRIVAYINEIRKLRALEIGRLPGYWEPMVGGLAVFHKIRGGNIYGSDAHPWLIHTHKYAFETGWRPPEIITEEIYYQCQSIAKSGLTPSEIDKRSSAALVGFVGFACSHSGKWFSSPAREKRGQPIAERVQQRSYAYKVNRIDKAATFFCSDFMNTDPPETNMIVYCDPPYLNAEIYRTGLLNSNGMLEGRKFDHDKFWEKVRSLENEGHTVMVSETQAPLDFSSALKINMAVSVSNMDGGGMRREENLFRYGNVTPVQRRLL